jgi:hypothetical protein
MNHGNRMSDTVQVVADSTLYCTQIDAFLEEYVPPIIKRIPTSLKL